MLRLVGMALVIVSVLACHRPPPRVVANPSASAGPGVGVAGGDRLPLECETSAVAAREEVCQCDEVAADVRRLCAAMLDGLTTNDVSRLDAHVAAEIRARGCIDKTCTSTRYRGASELHDAIAMRGSLHRLLGLEGTIRKMQIRYCPRCGDDEVLEVCVSPVAADGPSQSQSADWACLGGARDAWRSIASRTTVPDVDADKDDIPLGRDACPFEPERYDGSDDDDGCPEDEAFIAIDRDAGRILLERNVEFVDGGATIARPSLAVLDQVAWYLRASPHRSLRIHLYVEADPHPFAAEPLATQRADAIRQFLIARGVEPDRVQTVPTTGTITGPAPSGPVAQTLDLRIE
jgi:outer membrane protein OmpA-like peptidoglycan-associated protein